jgi:hypothetical protein
MVTHSRVSDRITMDSKSIRAIKEAIQENGLSRRELFSILSIIEKDVWKKERKV